MLGNLMQKGTFRFPEMGSVARSIDLALRLIRARASRKHALLASAAGVAIVAVGLAAVGYVHHTHNLAAAQLATNRVEAANMDLQDELAQLRDKVAASNRDLMAAQGRVVALTEEVHARTQAQAVAPAEPMRFRRRARVTRPPSCRSSFMSRRQNVPRWPRDSARPRPISPNSRQSKPI